MRAPAHAYNRPHTHTSTFTRTKPRSAARVRPRSNPHLGPCICKAHSPTHPHLPRRYATLASARGASYISKENNGIRRDIGLLYMIEKVLRRVLYPRRTEMDSKKKKKKNTLSEVEEANLGENLYNGRSVPLLPPKAFICARRRASAALQ